MIFFLAMTSFTALSQDWIIAGKDADGVYLIKKHSQNSSKIWSKYVSKKLKYSKNSKTLYTSGYSMCLFDIDCADRKIDLRSSTTYSNDGRVLSSFQMEDYDVNWEEVVPESVGEMILNKACLLLNPNE